MKPYRTPSWSKYAGFIFPATLLLYLIVGFVSAAEPSGSAGTNIQNEFIRIRVNPGPNEAGRFAVDTTGGDPSRPTDDGKVLIYGSREPWTSYTTVHIDGNSFIYGGSTTRRAGATLPTGQVSQPPHVAGETITMACRMGDIEVEQALAFARNPTTRVKDAARIAYTVTNKGNSPHNVGLRIVLDAMLGENDGAPLRIGEKAIAEATQLAGGDLPEYWQAFDSLSQPAVIAQGTLRGTGVTPPDRLQMVDWGTLADSAWDFPFPTGRDFTREGEQEQDTAVALYWDPRPLGPGESRTYATLYGVGGVSLSPAQISLGLTAPAEVDFQYEDVRAFPVVVYIENSGGFEARSVACTLELPQGLKLVEGDPNVSLGSLKPGETRQLSWRVVPTGEATGSLKIAASATSENLEPNKVERELIVTSPPQLSVELSALDALSVTSDNRHSPNPFVVKATVSNQGAQPARNVAVQFDVGDGLKLVDETKATQMVDRIDFGKNQTLSWDVRALGLPTGKLKLWSKVTAAGAKSASDTRLIDVPELTPELRVYPAEQTVPLVTDGRPTLLPISVRIIPARDFLGCKLSMKYDPTLMEPLYSSRGEAFVEAGALLSPWSSGKFGEGLISDIGGERGDAPFLNRPEGTLFTVVFTVKAAGKATITLEPTQLLTSNRTPVPHRVIKGYVTIQDKGS